MAHKELTKAVAYLRTSSMTNVGEDKDSGRRQRAAIAQFAEPPAMKSSRNTATRA
jgi:hypothetical protein